MKIAKIVLNGQRKILGYGLQCKQIAPNQFRDAGASFALEGDFVIVPPGAAGPSPSTNHRIAIHVSNCHFELADEVAENPRVRAVR